MDDENTPLLSKSISSEGDPVVHYVKTINEHLPWYKRPSGLWLIPLFGFTWVSSGMLMSSVGQFHASLLCREYLNRHSSNATSLVSAGSMISLRPGDECQAPEIQAFTAGILALFEVITGIGGTFSIGYYASLSDKYGRRVILILSYCNTILTLGSIVVMGMYWDYVGVPFLILSGLVTGLLGGTMLGFTMLFAYAADCTDPSKRSLVYSWLHASVYLGLAIGPYLGGVIVKTTGTIMTIVYIDFTTSVTCLLLIAIFIPESLPSKQPIHIRRLYEKSAKTGSSTATGTQERVAWHSHVTRSLGFFKPNGRNTNLILLAAIAFLNMLSYRGTLSVIILYTNRMFKWTEYEDGIMFSLISLVRLVTMLALLPILVHFYQEAFRKKQSRSHAKSSSGTSDSETQPDLPNVERLNVQAVFNPNSLDAVSSVQNLGEAALDLALDGDNEDSFQEPRIRQTSVDSIGSLTSSRTAAPGSPLFNSTNKKGAVTSASNPDTKATETRTKAQKFSDMKFDTWMIRLGFAINAITFVGYGLVDEGWMFYIATALHAVSIISSPSQKSLMTGLVEPSQFGAVLGAVQVVESIAAIFSPVVISWVYALTVKSMPEFVWYSCAGWATICVVLAFMVRQKQFRNNDV
ncbi:hypothetical protein BGZ80_003717 [Entomortierella chlamydospora]|uniref:MFS general substrate transporter n=1 Tax=Entomortierella chlamydospora TaxID=101097 RepID=A0A9P6N5V8_9FUNG|nr:hypothetical protein BGZ80_003717 [Entomortierella chlamydospora]